MKDNTRNISSDELFPTEWYENVTNAANYVLQNINVPEERIDEVICHIIDYNINKQIHDKLLNSIADDLPCYLSLIDTSMAKVFNEFKNIIDTCDICPSFKEHVLYFQCYDIEKDKKLINFWKALVKKDYPKLSLSTRELKSQDCIKLTIRKK